MIVRDGLDSDAEAGAALIRNSIRRLCAADHHDDPAKIQAWLANKTAAEFRTWLAEPGQSLLVAEHDGQLAGLGLVRDDGALLLLYVDPDHVSRGVGRFLLRGLEDRAQQRGATAVRVKSTETAFQFYRAQGYAPIAGVGARLAKSLRPE